MNKPTELEKKFAEAIVEVQHIGYGVGCPWCTGWDGTSPHQPDCIVLDAKKVLEVEPE